MSKFFDFSRLYSIIFSFIYLIVLFFGTFLFTNIQTRSNSNTNNQPSIFAFNSYLDCKSRQLSFNQQLSNFNNQTTKKQSFYNSITDDLLAQLDYIDPILDKLTHKQLLSKIINIQNLKVSFEVTSSKYGLQLMVLHDILNGKKCDLASFQSLYNITESSFEELQWQDNNIKTQVQLAFEYLNQSKSNLPTTYKATSISSSQKSVVSVINSSSISSSLTSSEGAISSESSIQTRIVNNVEISKPNSYTPIKYIESEKNTSTNSQLQSQVSTSQSLDSIASSQSISTSSISSSSLSSQAAISSSQSVQSSQSISSVSSIISSSQPVVSSSQASVQSSSAISSVGKNEEEIGTKNLPSNSSVKKDLQ